jgi:membrane dipeptidase
MRAPLLFDAHLDLSMNALEWNRDLTQPVSYLRQKEAGMLDKPDRGNATVSLPAMRSGRVGLCTATLIARHATPGHPLPGWDSQTQAWAQTQGQLAWYEAMEAIGEMTQIRTAAQLETHVALWLQSIDTRDLPIGYLLSLEGADSIYRLEQVEQLYQRGLRALGPAHYGPGAYAFGTDSDAPLSSRGKALLAEMARLNIILDVTHLCDTALQEALDLYTGPIWASHHNCRTLVPHNRQLSDDHIKQLLQREAVIGVALDAWMLIPNWKRGQSTPSKTGVSLGHVADHIDHICQLAGHCKQVGIGSDLDGAFGTEQGPSDLDTIADLQKIGAILQKRGYTELDIQHILYINWITFLKKHL